MKKLRVPLAVLLFLISFALFLWPHWKGHKAEKEEQQAVAVFQNAIAVRKVETAPDEIPYEDLLKAMETYNEELYQQRQMDLKDPWSYEQDIFSLSEYGISSEVFGILDIPSCGIELPIYLGASFEHLAGGAGVLGNTSMPIGGSSTNCVIAGHRGWYSAAMFRHLDRIEKGDDVLIRNLWGLLEYRVAEIKIIEPCDVQEILIQDRRDLVTLLTCHPYAGGSRQRLIVICERVP